MKSARVCYNGITIGLLKNAIATTYTAKNQRSKRSIHSGVSKVCARALRDGRASSYIKHVHLYACSTSDSYLRTRKTQIIRVNNAWTDTQAEAPMKKTRVK